MPIKKVVELNVFKIMIKITILSNGAIPFLAEP